MNVKPGDLARVVDGHHLGATCTVVRDVSDFWQLGRVMWECKFPRPMQWRFPPGAWSDVGDVPDSKLRRIAGPDAAREVFEEQALELLRLTRARFAEALP